MEIPWVIEEQTKVKHELLKNYIDPWMAILFSTQEKFKHPEKLTYVDGFSGPGIYFENDCKSTKCPGSPVMVAEIANKYLEAKPGREVSIICMDKNKKCVDMLQNHLEGINKYSQRWVVYQAEFDHKVNEILDEIETKRLTNQPIFFFIDPFGYTGYPMKTLKRILRYPMVELFVNFMIYDIVRFCEQDGFEQQLIEQFGDDKFKDAKTIFSPERRQAYLLNLYINNLQQIAGAKFVMPFRINTPDQRTRPRFYLIHVSKNIKALRLMKDNMAKVSDTPYRYEAIGVATDQMSLFEDPDKTDLRERIHSLIKSTHPRHITFEDVEVWAYLNTNGISKTIKEALLTLELQNQVKIERMPRQRLNTVTSGAKISTAGM